MGRPLGIAGAPIIQGAGDYTFGDLLHQGSTAQIKVAEDHITRRKVHKDYASCETGALQQLRDEHAVREAQILLLLRHPNIVQVRDFITASDHYCLVMEHIPGIALLHHVIQHQYLSETRARHYAHQIWRALDYLHGHAVVHLDLRIDNILLQDDQIKIIDFSNASVYTSQPLHKRRYICRSIHYTAPELLDPARETFEGPSVDIWSFGILLYIMVTGEMPFEGNSPEQVSRRIQQGRISYPGRLSPECRQLLKSMLATDPHQRITLTEVAHHPWFRTLPPSTDIPNRKPLKPPLDPFIVQMMARAFRI
ncbi:kinase-like domain-containing protein, partial [Fennellomyces sp. T-0311]